MPDPLPIGLRSGGGLIAALMLLAPLLKAAEITFEESVAPILKANCLDCHNAKKQKGELNLSTPEGIIHGGESGPAFKAGDPDHSHLFELVHKGEMPKKGDPLSSAEIETIRGWIAAGAKFAKPPVVAEVKLNQHDILPIVLLRCTACHGRQKQEGELDLRTVAGMKRGGTSGPALVPGEPGTSTMIQRIESEACPPQDRLLASFVRRPPASEVEKLKNWIAAGALEVDVEPDVATTNPDPLVSDEDREHWAFVAPGRTSGAEPETSNIDHFIGIRLKEAGLDFSPEADRDSLIRRTYLDVIGLPPSVPEWKRWRESDDPDWFAEMVDELLASPHYGERWGRYWLDLAGYADSEGGVSADPIRAVAWKYRDYVIDAFNGDKPYNEFLREQIAGDELLDTENADPITGEMVENLIATGFLRMGIDETGSRTMNYVENRIGVIADVVDVLGSSVMGLTMECVRCHSHKYDPIPQRDYYRLKAIFQGALDEHDWLSFKTRTLNTATPDHRLRVKKINPPLESKLKQLEAEKRKKVVQWQREMLRAQFPEQSDADREATFPALRRADNQRTQGQRLLVEKLQIAMTVPNDEQPSSVQKARAVVNEIDLQVDQARRQMEPPLAIRALWDRGEPSPTYIYRRGEHTSAGRMVGPGVPSALTDGSTPFKVAPPFPGSEKTGRRLAFAKWLTQPDHPLTSRVIVNRIWHHHFGTGLVKTLENFGVQGEPPSHPELLDWLAIEIVERGWSFKELHRMILNSRTWRQSSAITPVRLERDPQNRLLSRMPLTRMDAEALRDSLLFVSGKLDLAPGGPPDGVVVNREGFVNAKPTPAGGWRRSVYLQYRRTEIPSMLATFDYPEMGPNCIERSVSTVSPQGLMLMNNERVRELAAAFASRIEGKSTAEKISEIYEMALSRPPSEDEFKLGVETLTNLEKQWPGHPAGALEAYCHAILNSAGFLYVD